MIQDDTQNLYKAITTIRDFAERFLQETGQARETSVTVVEDGRPKNVKICSADQAAKRVPITSERLQELAEADIVPHFRVDSRVYFSLPELRAWISENRVVRSAGSPYPPQIFVQTTERVTPESLPSSLVGISHMLRHAAPSSGVYFLIKNDEVVYCGQSANVVARISKHQMDREKDFDRAVFMPVAVSDLLRVEGRFIRALNPRLNIAGLPGTNPQNARGGEKTDQNATDRNLCPDVSV